MPRAKSRREIYAHVCRALLRHDLTRCPQARIERADLRRIRTHRTTRGTAMARVRCITEMGMGVDVHGRDATKAARRAVSDAIRHSSLGFFRMLGKTANDMFVEVTVAVPDPSGVDTAAVAKELPCCSVYVRAATGGVEVPAESRRG